MLKYATIKIGIKGNTSFKARYNHYKPVLCSKLAYLKKSKATGQFSSFDCDFTEVQNNCLNSFVYIEQIPLNIEICKNCQRNYCKLFVRT